MMYTATSAARISSGWVASELWKARAAPWNTPMMVDGMPISCCTRSISRTASPSGVPSDRLNDRLTAGSMPLWLICSGPERSGTTCAMAASGTISPVSGERRWNHSRLSARPRWRASSSRITLYWLTSVWYSPTWRWPKAS
ncbi:hypothetical protein D3C78_505140 [compost metagenome]